MISSLGAFRGQPLGVATRTARIRNGIAEVLSLILGDVATSENAQYVLLAIGTGHLAREGRYAYAYALN